MKKEIVLIVGLFFCSIHPAQHDSSIDVVQKYSLTHEQREQIFEKLNVCFPLEIVAVPTIYPAQTLRTVEDFCVGVFSLHTGNVVFRTAGKTVELDIKNGATKTFSHCPVIGVNANRTKLLFRSWIVHDIETRKAYGVRFVQEIESKDFTSFIVQRNDDNSFEKFSFNFMPDVGTISMKPFAIDVPNRTQDVKKPIIINIHGHEFLRITLPSDSKLSSKSSLENGFTMNNYVFADIVPMTGLLTMLDAKHSEIVQLQLPMPGLMSDIQLCEAFLAVEKSKQKAQQIILAAFKLATPDDTH